jgi:GTP-binding protein HflX
LADTVGFVRDLPHELVAAFRSTLQEAREATLLLHVIDASDPERMDRIAQVNEVLESIEAQQLPQIEVYNKIDRTGDAARIERDADGHPLRVWLSAHTGDGVDLLHAALHAALGVDLCHCRLRLSPSQGRARARLFAAGAVVGQRPLEDGWLEIEVSLRRHELERICREEGIELPAVTAPCAAAGRFLQSDRLTAVS